MLSDVFIKLDRAEWEELSAEQWMSATEYAHEQGRLYGWLKKQNEDDTAKKVRDAFRQYLAVGEWGYSIEWAFISGEKAAYGDLDRERYRRDAVSKVQDSASWVPHPRTPSVEEAAVSQTGLHLLRALVEGVRIEDALAQTDR